MLKNDVKLIDVISPLLYDIKTSDEIYGQIVRLSTSNYKCSPKIKYINYYELCEMSNSNDYILSIIQNNEFFNADTDNYLNGAHEDINACYRIDPFENAIVIARKISKDNYINVYRLDCQDFIKKSITVPHISCFKHLFKYFDVYKSDGTLAKCLNDLLKEKEVIAISRSNFEIYDNLCKFKFNYILKWYK